MLIKEHGLKICTIDPGRNLGWACWYSRDLIACGLTRSRLKEVGGLGLALAEGIPVGADRVYVEQMVHYPGKTRSKQREEAQPNDLIQVTALGAIVAGRIDAKEIHYLPAIKWKGTRPTEGVIEKIVDKTLGAEETAIYEAAMEATPRSLRHNIVDAVAIGLWLHGRMR